MSENKDIFIIDDSTTNIVLLEAILETKGHSVRTALSVKAALPQIIKNKPSLILLDLLMPNISGFDFMEKMKNDPELSNIAIIVISALTDEKSIKKTFELGAAEFLKKPLDIPSLMSAVERVLS